MYNLETDTIVIGDISEKIVAFEVWFQIPFAGIFKSKEQAIKACKEMDFDPQLVMVPVPVAVGESSLYELLIK